MIVQISHKSAHFNTALCFFQHVLIFFGTAHTHFQWLFYVGNETNKNDKCEILVTQLEPGRVCSIPLVLVMAVRDDFW